MKLNKLNNMNAKNEVVVILSAERFNLSISENQLRTKLLEKTLINRGIAYSKALGCYNESIEDSFVCLPKNEDDINYLIRLALVTLSQESILIREDGQVKLIFIDNVEIIGNEIKKVSKEYAQAQICYTKVNGAYYVVK